MELSWDDEHRRMEMQPSIEFRAACVHTSDDDPAGSPAAPQSISSVTSSAGSMSSSVSPPV